ncbi:Protein of unknown function [Pyronema omphalodes CBS 100304]|uniref:Uncharacterized protein n=1 Tax=Pyronema omphalodes (strain CBS 100304) TaxID=1076935 RepID=U4LNU8_PYROM|nr:Protein of unknown function [Pyronema omphalodes CBS 100304]
MCFGLTTKPPTKSYGPREAHVRKAKASHHRRRRRGHVAVWAVMGVDGVAEEAGMAVVVVVVVDAGGGAKGRWVEDGVSGL